MLPLLLLFSLMVHLAGAASTECPATDPACSNYRSVWNIISTCAFTLIICIWNATYPNITLGERWYKVVFYRAALALLALVTPEVTIVRAYSEWRYAGQIRGDFSSQQWTRAHGFFALMQGFNLQDGTRRQLLKTRDDLICLREGKIINPKITKEEIHGRSKSDGLRNTLLALQLSWFILQVITRATNHLAITLVELDTLALAVLSLPLFFFWWSKPMEVECRHVFYSSTSSSAGDGDGQTTSSELDAAFSVSRSKDEWLRELTIGGAYSNDIGENILVLSLGWLVFGGLHLIAWDFQFPSQAEKIAWRVASLALIAAPGLFFLDYYGVRWYYMIVGSTNSTNVTSTGGSTGSTVTSAGGTVGFTGSSAVTNPFILLEASTGIGDPTSSYDQPTSLG
ncbi:hypothetical protein PAXINDRAFT_100364 [Paxillus involutus ATCC 200175]|uniref:Unplaced genomic scaffold PAXINscaffold_24, whole genome shotgun sequence n=1 Tax=Paxillus involutus ATCC 200175 TaxID=664439 RepID=A0A0C9SWP2_PAXIN|nr:hypothetical protein PAXINDRAFT_100364 [Paxillus involutus ATCC 200175]